MAKQIYEKTKNIKLIGTLEKSDNGYVVVIENKDNIEEIQLEEVLEDMVGTEISLTSVDVM